MRIGDHQIGTSRSPFIIAEIGVNHDGGVDRARQLVSAAAEAGADAVKFQFFTAERLLSRNAQLAEYQREAGVKSPFSMLEELELSIEEMILLADYAIALKIEPLVTVFSVEHVPAMHSLPWAAYKIASPDIINRPLIDAIQQGGKPIILSTGASTTDEIIHAASWVRSDELALMQCVSAYPTPDDSAHLGAIARLRELACVPVGYSDHTTHEHTGGLAVAAGATLLEKHITLDRSAAGPDHAMSLDPAQFANYVKFARLAAEMLGDCRKIVHDIERDVRTVSRQSIVAAKSLKAGQTIRREDLTIKRPGGGLAPSRLESLIGVQVRADVEADTVLTDAHVDATPAVNHRPSRIDAAARAA